MTEIPALVRGDRETAPPAIGAARGNDARPLPAQAPMGLPVTALHGLSGDVNAPSQQAGGEMPTIDRSAFRLKWAIAP